MVYGLWIGWATSLIEEVNCVPMKNQEMRGNSYCLIGVKCAPMHEVLSKLIVVCLFWIIEWKGELKLAPFAERGLSIRRSRSPSNEVPSDWGLLKLKPSWRQAEAKLTPWKMSQSMWRSTGLGSFTISGWSHGTCRDLCSILQVLAGIVMIMELVVWCQSGSFSHS